MEDKCEWFEFDCTSSNYNWLQQTDIVLAVAGIGDALGAEKVSSLRCTPTEDSLPLAA